ERLWIALPMFLLAAAVPILQAWRSTGRASFAVPPQRAVERLALRLLTAFLYVLQPIARLWGRVAYGLSPWRRHAAGFCLPVRMNYASWSENWQAPARWLEALEKKVREAGPVALRGGDFDRWDLEVPGGIFGSCRVRMAVEEHGSGRQLVRFRSWPCCS